MRYSPLRSAADSVLHNLRLGNGADLLKELLELPCPQTRSKLLHKDGTAISLVLAELRSRLSVAAAAVIFIVTPAILVSVPIPISAAAAPILPPMIVSIPVTAVVTWPVVPVG